MRSAYCACLPVSERLRHASTYWCVCLLLQVSCQQLGPRERGGSVLGVDLQVG